MKYCFDIETDGLLDETTQIWCIVLKDIETEQVHKYYDDTIEEGVAALQNADTVIGHNIIDFDESVLEYNLFNNLILIVVNIVYILFY